jgi:NAD(P)H-dependent FMN reductase
MINIKIILGSTRDSRFGNKISDWVLTESSKNSNIKSEVIDLKDYDIPFFNLASNPSYMEDPGYSDDLKKLSEKLSESDGFIFVMPEYNHGYTGVLKNMIDTFYNEWKLKPATFVSYGGISGGIRAVEQLRLVLIELQMVPIRASVHIPFIFNQFSEEGLLKEETKEASNIELMINDLEWWANTLKLPREQKLK